MQFYLNGYTPGDPDISQEGPRAPDASGRLPEKVDVLVVGSGPAGTLLGAQLAAFPGIRTRVIERLAARSRCSKHLAWARS
jgi:phenol 2-monooxygenase (NADPH)